MNWERKITTIFLIVVLCIVEVAIFIDGPDVTDDDGFNDENVILRVWISQDGKLIYVFYADNMEVWNVDDHWRGVAWRAERG